MAFRSKFTGEQIDALLDLIEPETTYKFYDCFWGDTIDGGHDNWPFIAVKHVDLNTGDVYISPDIWNGVVWPYDSNYLRTAVMHVPDVRYYGNNKWLSPEEIISNDDVCGFDFNAHPEITEEEFYHIPEDEFYYDTPEDAEKLFNRIDAILERGRQTGLTDEGFSGMPLTPWIKMINRNEDNTIENITFSNATSLYGINTEIIGGGEYNGWENVDIVKKYEFGQFDTGLRVNAYICQATLQNGEKKYWYEAPSV